MSRLVILKIDLKISSEEIRTRLDRHLKQIGIYISDKVIGDMFGKVIFSDIMPLRRDFFLRY